MKVFIKINICLFFFIFDILKKKIHLSQIHSETTKLPPMISFLGTEKARIKKKQKTQPFTQAKNHRTVTILPGYKRSFSYKIGQTSSLALVMVTLWCEVEPTKSL